MSLQQRFDILRDLAREVEEGEKWCRNGPKCCVESAMWHHSHERLRDFLRVMDFHYPQNAQNTFLDLLDKIETATPNPVNRVRLMLEAAANRTRMQLEAHE